MVWIAGLGFALLAILWLAKRSVGKLPEVGQAAVDFALPDQQGQLRKLADYQGKWLVLYFYPKDETPGCTLQACRFRDDIQQIHALGAEVVGVSVDNPDSHAEFARRHHLPFPLLADKNGETAVKYGSLMNLLLIKFARRNTFIINPQGKIAKIYLSASAKYNSEQVVSDLRKLQTL